MIALNGANGAVMGSMSDDFSGGDRVQLISVEGKAREERRSSATSPEGRETKARLMPSNKNNEN